MDLLKKEDYMEIYLGSMLASYDYDTLILLYQPIVGYQAISIYLTMWSQYKMKSITETLSHEDFLKLTSITLTDFENARGKLEAIGLMKTYRKKEANVVTYCYKLYAPKTPGDFFNDPLFCNLYKLNIPERIFMRNKMYFEKVEPNLEGYIEMTKTFPKIFGDSITKANPNLVHYNSLKNRKIRDISKGFDFASFNEELKINYQINPDSLQNEAHQEIERIALLFGLDEKVMADLVSRSYNINQIPHLDNEKLLWLAQNEGMIPVRKTKRNGVEQYDESTILGQKIQLMSTTSAFDYLKLKQNNTMPSTADIDLINKLSRNQGLNSSVINALIDYVLETQNNTLPRKYTEKIAASLQREKIDNSLDAMNYLYAIRKKQKKVVNHAEESSNREEVSDNEVENLKKILEDV